MPQLHACKPVYINTTPQYRENLLRATLKAERSREGLGDKYIYTKFNHAISGSQSILSYTLLVSWLQPLDHWCPRVSHKLVQQKPFQTYTPINVQLLPTSLPIYLWVGGHALGRRSYVPLLTRR